MHMSETKKRRGRPVGTDLKMDKIGLEQVADAMIADPALKPMKAIYDTGTFTGSGYRQLTDHRDALAEQVEGGRPSGAGRGAPARRAQVFAANREPQL
jgi:hypothetical protein